MRLSTVILTGVLALGSLPLLSAKSYDIVIDSPAKAGILQLAPGKYKVKLVGTSAVFTNKDTGKKLTAPVKVKNAPDKFEYTAVDTTNKNGATRLKAIDLGGSTTELDFGD
ncbi:MAG TPA: hypothetical protein VMG35_12240 [Bryobacteraceae bacterium]|nr:hypothetical protein [Bryobacteraceae bacterium]